MCIRDRYPIFIIILIFLPPTHFLVTFLVLLSFILFPRLSPPLSRTSSLLAGQNSIGYLLDSRYWLPCGYKLHNPCKRWRICRLSLFRLTLPWCCRYRDWLRLRCFITIVVIWRWRNGYVFVSWLWLTPMLIWSVINWRLDCIFSSVINICQYNPLSAQFYETYFEK